MSTRLLVAIMVLSMIFLIGNLYLSKKNNAFKPLVVDRVSDQHSLGYSGQQKIVVDQQGRTFIAYRKEVSSYAEIFVARVELQQSAWQVSHTDKPIVSVNKKTEQRVPSIALDSEGTIHVVWYGSDTEGENNDRQIKYTRSSDQGDHWLAWRNISYVSGYQPGQSMWQEHPSLITHKHSAYVVWEGKDEQHQHAQIKFSKSANNGNTWTPWKNIHPIHSVTQSRPTITRDSNGLLYVFMYAPSEKGAQTTAIHSSQSNDGGESWSEWLRISDPQYDARHISATVDPAGRVHVVWRQQGYSGGPTQVMHRVFQNGTWSTVQAIAASPRYQFFPNIITLTNTITDDSSVAVTWFENESASGFPHEQPASGQSFVSLYHTKTNRFGKAAVIGQGRSLIYPHVASAEDQSFLSIIALAPELNRQHPIQLYRIPRDML